MEIQKYFNQKKDLYNDFLSFVENDGSDETALNNLSKIVNDQDILSKKEELAHFLRLISNINNNRHKIPQFFNKIKQIF